MQYQSSVSCCLFMYATRHHKSPCLTVRDVAYLCMPRVTSPHLMPASYRALCCLFMYAVRHLTAPHARVLPRLTACRVAYPCMPHIMLPIHSCMPRVTPTHRACPRLTAPRVTMHRRAYRAGFSRTLHLTIRFTLQAQL